MSERACIVAALHAMRGADLALCSYAEHGKAHDIEAAYDAARRLYRAIRAERKRTNQASRPRIKSRAVTSIPCVSA